MPVIRSVVLSAIVLGALVAGREARADVKAACVAASTQGQSLRDGAKLKEARAQFVLCARDECPSVVRKYCAEWLSDVERRIPSAVFRMQTAEGSDVPNAHVTVDGIAVPNGTDGSAVTLNPGAHDVRYESAGEEPIVEHVIIVEGERGRVLTGRLPKKIVAAEPPPESAPESHGVAPITYVLGGVGVLGLAGFAYFGLTANSDLSHLRNTCAPFCASSDLDSAKHEALFADVSLGIGLVALGIAAYTLLHHPHESTAATLIDVRPLPGGGMARIGASF